MKDSGKENRENISVSEAKGSEASEHKLARDTASLADTPSVRSSSDSASADGVNDLKRNRFPEAQRENVPQIQKELAQQRETQAKDSPPVARTGEAGEGHREADKGAETERRVHAETQALADTPAKQRDTPAVAAAARNAERANSIPAHDADWQQIADTKNSQEAADAAKNNSDIRRSGERERRDVERGR